MADRLRSTAGEDNARVTRTASASNFPFDVPGDLLLALLKALARAGSFISIC